MHFILPVLYFPVISHTYVPSNHEIFIVNNATILLDEILRRGNPAEAHTGCDELGYGVQAQHAAVHIQRREGPGKAAQARE